MTTPKTILFAGALVLGYIPWQAYAEDHKMNVGPSSPGVCSMTSKYAGEAHKITIKWTGPADPKGAPIDLEASSSDGILWVKGEVSPTEAVFRASNYTTENISAIFNIKKKKSGSDGGGSGGLASPEGKGYANQIQIYAYPPGGGERIQRPTKDVPYYGILASHASNLPTKLDLVFNSKEKTIGKNTITLTLPKGVESPGLITGKTNTIDPDVSKTIEVRLKENFTELQTINLKLENYKGIGSAEDGVTLIPVEIKVNKTLESTDDLVAVSKGVDEDLATDFSVKVSGMDGLTAELSTKGTDGSLKFKDESLNIPNGTEAITKLWGVTPSSDKDKTIIVVVLKKDGKELSKVEKEVTVFKGIKLEFNGIFGSPIDSVQEGWRPGAIYGDPADVISSDIPNRNSTISFYQGDQGGVVGLRPHSPKPNVKIKKAETIAPNVVLYEVSGTPVDPQIAGAEVWFQRGRFEPTGKMGREPDPTIPGDVGDPSTKERIIPLAELEIKGANSLFKITSTSDDPRLVSDMKANAELADIRTQIEAAKATDKLAAWIYEYDITTNPRKKAKVPGGPKTVLDFLEKTLSRVAGTYSNKFFTSAKTVGTGLSISAKGLIGAEEFDSKKIEFKATFEKWNGWTLTGEVNKGTISN